MKYSNLFRIAVIAVALSVGIVGCKKTPKPVTTIPYNAPITITNNVPVDPTPTRTGNTSRPTTTVAQPNNGLPLNDGSNTGTKLNDPNGFNTTGSTTGGTTGTNIREIGERPAEGTPRDETFFAANTVYFDLDRSSVRPAELGKIEAVATYLKNEPTTLVEVEGHCDERGTEEYNRALGERRSLAIRQQLLNLGVSSDRVSTISFGEDKPADPGHDDAAWAKNRRGAFILLRPNTASK